MFRIYVKNYNILQIIIIIQISLTYIFYVWFISNTQFSVGSSVLSDKMACVCVCVWFSVYECGPWCSCDRSLCQNRLVQRGIRIRLQVFQTDQCGWGVRCRDDLDRGTFVCIYAGDHHVCRSQQLLANSVTLHCFFCKKYFGQVWSIINAVLMIFRCDPAAPPVGHWANTTQADTLRSSLWWRCGGGYWVAGSTHPGGTEHFSADVASSPVFFHLTSTTHARDPKVRRSYCSHHRSCHPGEDDVYTWPAEKINVCITKKIKLGFWSFN